MDSFWLKEVQIPWAHPDQKKIDQDNYTINFIYLFIQKMLYSGQTTIR